MAAPEHKQALDRLQSEVNRTLENIGHLFKAANTGSRSATVTRASQLKRSLPVSTRSFEDALNTLEDEIQMAKVVMRRDLAICREQAEKRASPQPVPAKRESDGAVKSPAKDEVASEKPEIDAKPVPVMTEDDVQTQEPEPAAPEVPVQSPQIEATKVEDPDVKPTLVDSPATPLPDEVVEPATEDSDSKPSDPALKVDTSTDQPAQPGDEPQNGATTEDNNVPDTATVSEGQDLESLFNDPTSGTNTNPSSNPATAKADDAPDFPAFDFNTFTNGLDSNANDTNNHGMSMPMDADDSISALLPGLQDYANTQPPETENLEEPDFNALFASDAPIGESGHMQAGEGDGQRDTTFDDIMGFAEFGDDGQYEGGGEGGATGEGDFDFHFG